ncbi:PQ-loop domain-containing transporter [Dolichospermum planctonicum]
MKLSSLLSFLKLFLKLIKFLPQIILNQTKK